MLLWMLMTMGSVLVGSVNVVQWTKSVESCACQSLAFDQLRIKFPLVTTGLGSGWAEHAIVTVKLRVLVLVQQSVATHFTVVIPGQNKVPEGGVHTTVALLQHLLVAVTV